MKIGSLFSGYGGLDIAAQRIFSAEIAWHCEFAKAPSKVLEKNYPGIPNYSDVTKVDWSAVEPVDILTGGFPCQDVSHAGSRKGLKNGTRSGLWSEYHKAISIIKPKYVIIENVRGLLSAKATGDMEHCKACMGDDPDSVMRALQVVLADLAESGYDAVWQDLRASDIGAPHQRQRIFIVAYPSGSAY
jgi:DNA (cytosine-5)-methyltransferase 1